LIPSPTIALEIKSQVDSVLDGDTIQVLHNQHAERIRLHGIDGPGKRQAYGKRPKQAVSELVFGKDVTLQTYGKDKYGCTIAHMLLVKVPTSITRSSNMAGAGESG
jgi:micrococcal nuclease